MRVAFLILLLANGLLFFWGQSRLGAGESGREPERMAQQLSPDKLRIVPVAALKPAFSSPSVVTVPVPTTPTAAE